jgi:hypothetical protein
VSNGNEGHSRRQVLTTVGSLRRKSRKCRFLDDSVAAALCSGDTKLRGRFYEKRFSPSHLCARNASAALENFVRHRKRTFSTVSANKRHRSRMAAQLHPIAVDAWQLARQLRAHRDAGLDHFAAG